MEQHGIDSMELERLCRLCMYIYMYIYTDICTATWNRLCLFWMLARGACLSLIYSSIEDIAMVHNGLYTFYNPANIYIMQYQLYCLFIHCNARINSFICKLQISTNKSWLIYLIRSGSLNTNVDKTQAELTVTPVLTRRKQS